MNDNGIVFNDNRLVQRRKWGGEFLRVVLREPNNEYHPRICSLTRYCVPGRIDSYSFYYVPGKDGVCAHVQYLTETNSSLPDAIKAAQADIDKPGIVEMLTEMCGRPDCRWLAHKLAENLVAVIAPKSKALRAMRRAIKIAREKARQIRDAMKEKKA